MVVENLPAQAMSAREGDDFAIVEAHAVEDVAQVVGWVSVAAVGVGKAACHNAMCNSQPQSRCFHLIHCKINSIATPTLNAVYDNIGHCARGKYRLQSSNVTSTHNPNQSTNQ